MITIKNLSPNPLTLSDGTMLTQFESKTVKSLGDREQKYQRLGWIQIIEVEATTETEEKPTGGKKK